MSILFDEDTRRRLTNFVGFSREEIAAEVLALGLGFRVYGLGFRRSLQRCLR